MAGENQNDGTQGASSGSDADLAAAEMNKFAGFAVNNGDVIKPVGEPAAGAPAVKAAKVVKAGTAEDEQEDGQQPRTGRAASAQGRIDKAVRAQREAERERDRMAGELAAARGGSTGAAPRATTTTASAPPDPDKFDGGDLDPRYIAALARYEATEATKQVVAESRAADQSAATTRADAANQQAFMQQRGEFAEKGADIAEDFDEVVFDDDNRFSPVVVTLAFDSEFGPQIMYELAQDRKEQKAVFGMSPPRQAAWFGKKEAELSSKTQDATGADEDGEQRPANQNPPKNVSRAPAPPVYSGSGRSGSPKINASTTDFAAFEHMVNAGAKK